MFGVGQTGGESKHTQTVKHNPTMMLICTTPNQAENAEQDSQIQHNSSELSKMKVQFFTVLLAELIVIMAIVIGCFCATAAGDPYVSQRAELN